MCENNGISKILHKIDLRKCRLCQENAGCIEFLKNSSLFERITFCTRINIENNDENEQLPKLICENCNQILNDVFQFHEKCLNIDKQLKKLLTKQKLKRKVVKATLSKSPILNRKKLTVGGKKSNKGEKLAAIKQEKELEDIVVKIEPEISENTSAINTIESIAEEHVLCIAIIPEEINEKLIKNEVDIAEENEVINKNSLTSIEENHENDSEFEVSEELSNQSYLEDSSSEDDFKQRIKKVRKIKNEIAGNYVCSYNDCGKVYATKGGLKKHNYSQHNIRDFLCTTCGKNFGRYSGLKAHERIHSATKAYSCPKCNTGFAQAANLRTHIKLHHEGHRYYCTKCGKGFLTSCTLKRHELIHIGKKDFKCDMCPSEFYTPRELIKHKKYHYDIRSHFCNICYKSFVEKHHLTIHMRSHTGERPYVCDVNGCGKSFMDSQKLRRHKKNVHRQKI